MTGQQSIHRFLRRAVFLVVALAGASLLYTQAAEHFPGSSVDVRFKMTSPVQVP